MSIALLLAGAASLIGITPMPYGFDSRGICWSGFVQLTPITTCVLPDRLVKVSPRIFRKCSFHVAVKPADRTSDCCRSTRKGFLDDRIIAESLIEVGWRVRCFLTYIFW